MTNRTLLFGSCFLALAGLTGTLVACSVDADIAKSSGVGPATAGDGGSSGSSGSSGGDASTPDDAGVDARVATTTGWKPTTFTPGGYVFAGQAGTVASSYVSPYAVFQGVPAGTCEERKVAASGGVTCTVTRCAVGAAPSPTTRPHAGSISFGTLATIQPEASGAYMLSGASPPWTSWSTLSVAAAGGDIPAFAGTIELPGELVVTKPAGNIPGQNTPLPAPLSKSAGFATEWVTGGAGNVRVHIYESFSAPKPGEQGHTVLCDAPRSLGALSIPGDAFADFTTVGLSAGGPHVGIQVSGFTESVQTVDTWRVAFMGTARGAVWEASDRVVP